MKADFVETFFIAFLLLFYNFFYKNDVYLQ
jgi:hypothetical protein